MYDLLVDTMHLRVKNTEIFYSLGYRWLRLTFEQGNILCCHRESYNIQRCLTIISKSFMQKGNNNGYEIYHWRKFIIVHWIYYRVLQPWNILLKRFKVLWLNQSALDLVINTDTFWPMFLFYTPWKHQKTRGFLVFSGGIK